MTVVAFGMAHGLLMVILLTQHETIWHMFVAACSTILGALMIVVRLKE